MRKKIFTLITFVLIIADAVAQTASGVIRDEEGLPVEGAYIVNLRSGTHAHANELGNFLLDNTRINDSIRISHIGYSSKTIVFTSEPESMVTRLNKAPFQLNEVVVNAGVRRLNIIAEIDLATNPVNSSQELLRKVPGLFIGQHAGGGKAEQIFLRGFDIDHGTDINISVDGMPVNMVSHAHGQGYADLHFLIPETIDKIDFDKGPYFASKGNLATAGYVAFKTKEKLENNSVSLETGLFNTIRTLGMFNLVNNEKQAAYIASEYLMTDGPFDSPQHFNRVNLTGKYTVYLPNEDKLSVGLSYFNSKWDASGQVPTRAVENGSISRFGAIDNTEGGHTGRTNLNLQFIKHLSQGSFVKSTAFFSKYDFELYSNFTFFLNDPVNGDQIRQKESRTITGFESEWNRTTKAGTIPVSLQAAIGFRNDAVRNNELSHTANRKTLINAVMLGDVDETNFYSYVNAEFKKGKWLINPALRIDNLQFGYSDKLAATYQSRSEQKTILSPKLNFLYSPGKNLQYFLKLGKGFHSNDTRVVVAKNGKEILPAAYGADLGVLLKPIPRMLINAAVWWLYLEQEFVYVGDEPVVEPGGKTKRRGIDLGLRYQLNDWLFLNADYTYTRGRNADEPKGQDYLPLAPKNTFTGGLSIDHHSGFSGALKTRWLGDRAADEENRIVAKGYLITDMNLNYKKKHLTFGIKIENLFNNSWNETQFATESRLYNEPQPVSEIHFTPGIPFNLKGVVQFSF